MRNPLNLQEFFIEGGDQTRSHVLLHVTEPSNNEERSKGYFFAACEINNGQVKQIMKLQNIIDEIENAYYETRDTAEKNALEIVLEKINNDCYPLLSSQAKLSCIVGTIKDGDIIFSFYGKPIIYLFYKKQTGEYRIMDLVEANSDSTVNQRQLFSQIIQGRLNKEDCLFLGTPNIGKYFDHERLLKIITTRPVRQGADHLNRVLSELKNEFSFGGVIIKLEDLTSKRPEILTNPHPTPTNDIYDTEKKTNQILNAGIIPKAKPNFIENKNPESNEEKSTPTPKRNLTDQDVQKIKAKQNDQIIKILRLIASTAYQTIIWILNLFWWFFAGLIRQTVLLFFVITNYQNRRRNIMEIWQRQWRSHKENFSQMSRSTKALLLASLIISLIFIGSLVYLSREQKQKAILEEHNKNLSEIRTRLDSMEGAMIYGNEDAIAGQISTVKDLITKMDCKKYSVDCNNLQDSLTQFIKKISKVSLVSPEILLNASSTGADFSVVVKINNKILVAGENTSTIGIYDLVSKEFKTQTVGAAGFVDGATPKENDYSLLLAKDGKLYKFDPTKNIIKEVEIDYPENNSQIVSIASYNRKLYSLDVLNKKIYRHVPTQGGFGRGDEWTSDSIDALKDGVDLTIDGDMIVFLKTGGVIKMSQGKQTNFTITRLFPPLQNTNAIWTYNNLNHIYILDKIEKRLVIINPDGAFYKQIAVAEFNSPTSMSVDESSGYAYIIDSGNLYKISL